MLSKNNTNIPLLAMLTAVAIVISLLERLVPLDFMIVGAKLGLANVVTIFVIYKVGKNEALLVLLTRICVVTLLTGRVSSFLFSFSGGIFAFFISNSLINYYKKNVTFVGICIAGSAFHHIGQIIAGIIVLSNLAIIAYLPYLLLISIPLGFITGNFIEILLTRLGNIEFNIDSNF